MPDGAVRLPYQAGYSVPSTGLAAFTMEWRLPSKSPGLVRQAAETWLESIRGPRRELERNGISGIEATGDEGAAIAFYDTDSGVTSLQLRYRNPQARAQAQAILDSVIFDPNAVLDPLLQVDLTFTDMAGWRVFPMAGPAVTVGEEAKGLAKDVYWPGTLTVQFQSVFPPDGEDLMWFNALVLKSRDAKDVRTKKVAVDGLEGVEFEATGASEGHAQQIYGIVLRGESGCFSVTGTVDLTRGAAVLPLMKRIAHSLRRTDREATPASK